MVSVVRSVLIFPLCPTVRGSNTKDEMPLTMFLLWQDVAKKCRNYLKGTVYHIFYNTQNLLSKISQIRDSH